VYFRLHRWSYHRIYRVTDMQCTSVYPCACVKAQRAVSVLIRYILHQWFQSTCGYLTCKAYAPPSSRVDMPSVTSRRHDLIYRGLIY